MTEIDLYRALIKEALREDGNLSQAIERIRRKIEDADLVGVDPIRAQILRTLAYDLEFYVPNELDRSESSSYYGDDRALRELRKALIQLE